MNRENWMALIPLAFIMASSAVLAALALAGGPYDHNINPVLVELGAIQVRYYGLVYMVGFTLVYILLRHAAKKKSLLLDGDAIEKFVLLLIAGVVIGARLFEVLIYDPSWYFSNPGEIVQIWKGGLSFHGGLAGVLFVTWLFSRKALRPGFGELCDLLTLPAMAMLAFGRVANFINGELYGGISTISWAVAFSGAEGYRHPVQLYEAVSYAISFGIMFFVHSFRPARGVLSACFLIFYGTFRFFVEFHKDYGEYGYETLHIGRLHFAHFLCFLMVAFGVYVLFRVFRARREGVQNDTR
jgi:phosphatidylglycerol:prolipoprotein diacylglycerol transferase